MLSPIDNDYPSIYILFATGIQQINTIAQNSYLPCFQCMKHVIMSPPYTNNLKSFEFLFENMGRLFFSWWIEELCPSGSAAMQELYEPWVLCQT